METIVDKKILARKLVSKVYKDNGKVAHKFTRYALFSIAKQTIREAEDFKETFDTIACKFVNKLQSELESNLQDCEFDLISALEEDAEIPEDDQYSMEPRMKLKEYLENTCDIIGYTDDILKAVSAAYGVVLEPGLY